MGHGLNHLHIMRDQQVTQLPLALQSHQQGQHLLLHRHIERAGWLIEHQQLGLNHQGARDGDALALTAGKLMRIALQQAWELGLGQADIGQSLKHLVAALLSRHCRMVNGQPFTDDFFNGHARGQRGKGVLKHHLNLPPEGFVGRSALAPALIAEADLAFEGL